MKEYLLSYLGAFAVSVALALGMMLLGLAGWFFGRTPLWFDLLCAVLTLLPFWVIGVLLGRWAKRKGRSGSGRGVAILIALMAAAGLVMWRLDGSWLYVLGWPGMIAGHLPVELFHLKYRWGYRFYLNWVEPAAILLAHILLPVLFHLGWCRGKDEKR